MKFKGIMKHILKLQEQYGSELRTRLMMERLTSSLNNEDEYLFDFQGIEQISRSAADELYNLTHSEKHVETINISPFVQKMLDAVTLGRFQPRQHPTSTPIIRCTTMQSVSRVLMAK